MPARHFEEVQEFSLPRAAVWEVLSNTDRLNRHIGLPPVVYGEAQKDDEGPFRPAQARLFGLPMKWREYPFSWESEGRYAVVRIYESGPMARFEGGAQLEDVGNGRTRVTFFADIIGRGAWSNALVPQIARRSLRRTVEFCCRAFSNDGREVTVDLPVKASQLSLPLLANSLKELGKRSVPPEIVAALGFYLKTANDAEVASIRPFQWADRARLPRDAALIACLHAVKVGLLNLKWAMMCPNCRVAKSEVGSLMELADEVHCDLCGVRFDLNFDRYVELKFGVHPAIRRASEEVYCLAGPFSAPHVLVQTRLLPTERRFFADFTKNEAAQLRAVPSNQSVSVASNAPPVTEIVWNNGWSKTQARGGVWVRNDSSEPVLIVLERLEWDSQAVTAARVTALQQFRDLFSSEILRPGREIAVENTTLFFSDLSNSTALYERIGDAPAYARVGHHFDFLQKHVVAHNGAVVKTMGDAVMAIFATPADAVRAALQMQREFPKFRETLSDAEEIELKIGLHFGPTLAVTSNERLDYFGRTVNVAARTLGNSQGGDVVLTDALWDRDEVRAIIDECGAKVARFHTSMRGVEKEVGLVRVRP